MRASRVVPGSPSAGWMAEGRCVSNGRRPSTRHRDRASSHCGARFRPLVGSGPVERRASGAPQAITCRQVFAPFGDSEVPKGFAKNGDTIVFGYGFRRSLTLGVRVYDHIQLIRKVIAFATVKWSKSSGQKSGGSTARFRVCPCDGRLLQEAVFKRHERCQDKARKGDPKPRDPRTKRPLAWPAVV